MPGRTSVMIRYGVLGLLATLTAATPVWASGEQGPGPSLPSTTTPFRATTQPFPASRAVSAPLPPSLTAVPQHRHQHRHATTVVAAPIVAPAPQVIVVQQPVYYQALAAAPSECTSPGYWAYRWVPYTTTQTVWVQGSWAADGSWIDSHWESRPYSSGYYDPIWVPGQPYSC